MRFLYSIVPSEVRCCMSHWNSTQREDYTLDAVCKGRVLCFEVVVRLNSGFGGIVCRTKTKCSRQVAFANVDDAEFYIP